MSLIAAYLSTLGSSTPSPTIQLDPFYLIQDFIFQGGGFSSASAGFLLFNDSRIQGFTSRFGDQFLGNWIIPSSAAPGTYETRLSNLQGSPVTGSPLNVWIPLSSSAAWYVNQNVPGSSYSSFTIEIRLGASVLSSSNVVLEAIVDELSPGGPIP
jgi:hypothetical protein